MVLQKEATLETASPSVQENALMIICRTGRARSLLTSKKLQKENHFTVKIL